MVNPTQMGDDMAVSWKHPVLVRRGLMDRTGAVVGHSIHMVSPPGHAHGQECLDAIYAEYRRVNLASLTDGGILVVQATPQVLMEAETVLAGVERPVLEVPGWLVGAEGLGEILAHRRAQGWMISLAEFTGTPDQISLLDVVDMVGVDADDPRFSALMQVTGKTGVVARRPSTRGRLHKVLIEGADLAEACWIYPDDHTEPAVLAPDESHCLALLSALENHPGDPDRVSQVVSSSPELSVAVLRMVNSSAVALSHRVDSVRRATVLAGPRRLRTIAVAALAGAQSTGSHGLWTILSRARAVEQLTQKDAGYTVGLLSGLADVRRFPLDWLADEAGVSQQVTAALLARRGALGTAIAAVQALERGEPNEAAALGQDPWLVSQTWLDAVSWARSMLPRPDRVQPIG